ncbi:hypothetical protein OQA88_2148 [Cercophora sp. LCS_1]
MQSILKRLFPRETLPNITIMGLDGAGKTTLLYKLASSEITTSYPTVGISLDTAKIGKRFTARVADAGGCAKAIFFVRRIMLDDIAGLVWVVDAHDMQQLDWSVEELTALLKGGGNPPEEYAAEIPVLVLLNKVDLLPDGKVPGEIRTKFDTLLKGRRFAYFETQITSSTGMQEAFAWLAEAIAPKISGTAKTQEKPVGAVLADMRSPDALSAKLEEWLSRAEKDVSADELLKQFYALDLPSWDHYVHVRLAYVLLVKRGRREGKDKIFDGFKDYIDNSGKVHGKSFHTTMTYFWVQMVHLGIAGMESNTKKGESHTLKPAGVDEKQDANPGLVDDFARFLMVNPFLADGQLWADYYSKEVLMSKEAKEGVRFPDIKKLPDVLAPKAGQ